MAGEAFLPKKFLPLNFSILFLSFLPLSSFVAFFLFLFLCSFLLLVRSLISFSFLEFVDLASIMAESSQYWLSWNRNWVHWLCMILTFTHCRKVMSLIVVGHIHVAVECLWKFVSVTVVQSNPSEEFIPLCPLVVGFLFSLLPDVLSDLKSLLP